MGLRLRCVRFIVTVATVFLVSVTGTELCSGQDESVGFRDVNGDGKVSVAAFGDSLTFGVGDGINSGEFLESIPEGARGEGYPGRLSRLLGVPVVNAGVPGEEFLTDGVARFPSIAVARRPDYLVFLEGSNDAVRRATRGEYARQLQRIINVGRAEGIEVVVLTIPPPTGVHAALAPFTEAFSAAVLELAATNDVLLADLARAWRSSCPNLETCKFYSIPEGLHPNRVGYTAIAQVVASTLLGIDIFTSTGTTELEGALGLSAGDVVVTPDVFSAGEG